MKNLPRNVAELWHRDGAGQADKLAVAGASLVDALKLEITLLHALAALVAEVDEALGAAVSVVIDSPPAGGALRFGASTSVSIGHLVEVFV